MKTLSKPGLVLAALYLVLCAYLIYTQGLFGESFIALILGLPWSMLFAYFEYGNTSGSGLVVMLLVPLALNAYLLYWIGSLFGRLHTKN